MLLVEFTQQKLKSASRKKLFCKNNCHAKNDFRFYTLKKCKSTFAFASSSAIQSNSLQTHFESSPTNLIPASHIYLFEAKCFALHYLIVSGRLTFTCQIIKHWFFLPHKILILSSTKLSATPLSYWI